MSSVSQDALYQFDVTQFKRFTTVLLWCGIFCNGKTNTSFLGFQINEANFTRPAVLMLFLR